MVDGQLCAPIAYRIWLLHEEEPAPAGEAEGAVERLEERARGAGADGRAEPAAGKTEAQGP